MVKKPKPKNPPQIPNLLDEIKRYVIALKYIDSRHSQERQSQRNIRLPEVLYVLKTGRHEKNKTRYDNQFKAWHYAIRGLTVDKKDIRVVVTFDNNLLVIITVIAPTRKD